MQILDPGHKYKLTSYDGESEVILTFMKREGEMYPGNVGTHPGTNMQEVLRALIDRLRYVNNQAEDRRNYVVIEHLQSAIALLEMRAADRHGIPTLFDVSSIETIPTCQICGHITCLHGEM